MKGYSQNGEDLAMLGFLTAMGITKGTVLEIGANDGLMLSNSRLFIESGWDADLVEPSEKALVRLQSLYNDANLRPAAHGKVRVHAAGIGTETKRNAPFNDSDTHLKKGDVGLLSSFDENELKRWPGQSYTKGFANIVSWPDFFFSFDDRQLGWDVVSIDAEGFDFAILSQMDFNLMSKVRCLCVEWNSKDRDKYTGIMFANKFRLYHINAENLIFVR